MPAYFAGASELTKETCKQNAEAYRTAAAAPRLFAHADHAILTCGVARRRLWIENSLLTSSAISNHLSKEMSDPPLQYENRCSSLLTGNLVSQNIFCPPPHSDLWRGNPYRSWLFVCKLTLAQEVRETQRRRRHIDRHTIQFRSRQSSSAHSFRSASNMKAAIIRGKIR